MNLFMTQVKRTLGDIGYYLSAGKFFKKTYPSNFWTRRDNAIIMSPGLGGINQYVEGARLSFSFLGEDRLLDHIFARKNKGFYVDVGAHHPFKISNTALFYRAGWRGINIEPNPAVIELFMRHRSRDININMGVAEKEETLDYYMFDDPGINTFSEKYATSKINSGILFLEKKKIKVMPLAVILNEYLLDINQHGIDFMNIDCEAYDYEVLRSNNWEKFRPKIVVIECQAHIREDLPCCCVFLEQQGYVKIASMIITYFFVDKEIKFPFF